VNFSSRLSHLPAGSRPEPAALLGADHPLVRDLERVASAAHQIAAVAAVLAGSAAALLAGSSAAISLIAAAAATALVLLLRMAVLFERRRVHVLELIRQGLADLPIAPVENMCVRLRAARHRRQLIASVETVLRAEVHGWDAVVTPWVTARPDLLAPIRYELEGICRLLASESARLEGIATIELLLTDGTSTLHHDDVRRLHEDLRRARFLLT
jgi:hypothetical protein